MGIFMRKEILFACCLGLLVVAGCDTGAPESDEDGSTFLPPGSGPGGACAAFITSATFDSADGSVSAGVVFTIFGGNFDPILANNRVTFTAGNSEVEGMPFAVQVDAGSGECPRSSTLQGIVPGGVSSGNLELIVNGQSAGAVGYDAEPVIMGHTLGIAEDEEFLEIDIIGAFIQLQSRVTLYGLNFNDVREVVVSDSSGNSVRIPPNSFIRDFSAGQVPGVIPTGYDTLGFNLRDDNNDVRLPFQGQRDNLGVQVRGSSGVLSNRIEVPVSLDATPQEIGAVVNSVKVPTGVTTGPVRLHYSMYELQVNVAWTVEVDFKVDGVSIDGQEWFPARSLDNDPQNDGKVGLLAGPLLRASGGRLLLERNMATGLPGGGAGRTFVWDACGDANFRLINNSLNGGPANGRDWVISFRFRPTPEQATRSFYPGHTVETPPILYYDLADRATPIDSQRVGEMVEDFEDTARLDFATTSAAWGPPINPGLLVGSLIQTRSQFGEGRAVVNLQNIDDSNLPPNERIAAQGFVINTTNRPLRIEHNIVRADNSVEVIPVTLLDADGQVVDNPGESFGEFHFASLNVDPDVLLISIGDLPLVIRLSGSDFENTPSDELVFRLQSGAIIDTEGLDGLPGEDPQSTTGGPGAGGLAGAGAGDGGAGGALATGVGARVTGFLAAERGGNDGGGAGETPCAVHFNDLRPQPSTFPGAPGGGGGNRLPGRAGDYGSNSIPEYTPPRVGEGGPRRGNATLSPLSAGSGGGGGGGSLSRVNAQNTVTFTPAGGAGGGGGGGAIHVVTRGSMEILGEIWANGGDGGDGNRTQGAPSQSSAGGAGGGGSGGAILFQAVGSIFVSDCVNLQVDGGVRGSSGRQNRSAGAGNGGPGWIRLESSMDGASFCAPLEAEAILTDSLNASANTSTVEVDSTAGFPARGTLVIEEEEVTYESKKDTEFEAVTRGVNGTSIVTHAKGTIVRLKGAIQPAGQNVLIDGGLTVAPEPVSFGLGRDGVMHLSFIETIDPTTGEPSVDPDTGEPLSVWTFDTETSLLATPTGQFVMETHGAASQPGFLDLSQLIIDKNVQLRAVGSNALRISVRDRANIAGSINVSGFTGGALEFSPPGQIPLPGRGGEGGPGGGTGGKGGTNDYLNGPPNNPGAADTLPTDGERGFFPEGAEAFDRTEMLLGGAPFFLIAPHATGALGGRSQAGQACGANCIQSAGGGGGGGSLSTGNAGDVRTGTPPELAGAGGSPFGVDSMRFAGGIWTYGGTGGSGGGGNPHVSTPYSTGQILGSYVFPGRALHAPGTGGGGGGGVLVLSAANLTLSSTARLLARGGDAVQSIDLGGNGGGGGGGNIFLQATNSFSVEPGSVMDVRGGKANRLPPLARPGVRAYEGNVRATSFGAEPMEPGANVEAFGGLGGDGAPGRIRIEVPPGSALSSRGVNDSMSSGGFLESAVNSVAFSTIQRVGLGPGLIASSHGMRLEEPRIRIDTFRQADGARAVILWEGAQESLDVHAIAAEPSQLVSDPTLLTGTEFVRFSVYFTSNAARRSTRAIQDITLGYHLECE